MDKGRCSHVENTRPKENARGENRQNTKANRRCDAAKSIFIRLVVFIAPQQCFKRDLYVDDVAIVPENFVNSLFLVTRINVGIANQPVERFFTLIFLDKILGPRSSEQPHLPVVYMSAQAIDRDRCVPGSVFVAKPYQHTDILSACQRLRK